MPISTNQTILLAKLQTGAVFAAPAPTDWVEIIDANIEPMVAESKELTLIKSTFGAKPQQFYGLKVKLSFSVALAGSGTAGTEPYWGVLERICGMGKTAIVAAPTATPPVEAGVVFKPLNSGYEMGSLACYIGPNLHALHSARGTSSLELSVGGFWVRKYDITGVYIDPTAAVIPTVALESRVLPDLLLPTNTTLTLHGVTNLCLQSLSIDTGNDVKFKEFLNCNNPQASITDRQCKGSIEFVAESIASKDLFALAKSGAAGTLSFKLNGGAAGKKLTLFAPKVQLLAPQYGDADGDRTLKMDMLLIPATGGDDYSITCN